MLEFCGLEKVTLDANGRLKFSPRFLADFQNYEANEIVFHCLPEGALGIYPLIRWEEMKAEESRNSTQGQSSLLQRRQRRLMGAMTQKDKLSNQGRVTLPVMFRDLCSLSAGEEIVVLGCEVGVELWNAAAWAKEMSLMQGHSLEKGENEMIADLVVANDTEK